MNNIKAQSWNYCKRVQAPLALDVIDEVSLSGKRAVYMLIASRLSCREKIHCRVSVECLLVPVKCSRDSTNDVRGMLCRKYKSLDQAYVFLGQNPFCFIINSSRLDADRRHTHHLHPTRVRMRQLAQSRPMAPEIKDG